MPTRTKNQNTLSLGDYNALCDVCGFKFKSCDLKKRWDGLMVCNEDWEPRHPSDFFRAPKEDTSIPWSRPDATEAGGTDVGGNTFPPTFDATAKAQGLNPDSDADGLVEGDFLLNGEAVDETVSKA